MDIKDFKKPIDHPFGILQGYTHAFEKESVLLLIFSKCIEAGKFIPVKTSYYHPTMIEDGLLLEVGDRTYELTEKAKGLLYSVYHK